jgi:SseB protein N-terminal domain
MDRVILDSGFAGDVGDADDALRVALDAWVASGDAGAVRRALLAARVLVPVVAVAGERDSDGSEKSTDMAVITLRGEDGRTALPAFGSLAALSSWHAPARPLPISAVRAAQAALFENADLLVLDPAGPVTFTVEGPALRALAEGRVPVPAAEDPEVQAALAAALDPISEVTAAVLLPGGETDAILALVLGAGVDGERVARWLGATLAEHPVLRERLERGLDLAVLPAGRRLPTGLVLLDRGADPGS